MAASGKGPLVGLQLLQADDVGPLGLQPCSRFGSRALTPLTLNVAILIAWPRPDRTEPLDRLGEGPFAVAVVRPGPELANQRRDGPHRVSGRVESPLTWLQVTGMETGAPGRPRGERGATAVAVRSLRR